MSDEYLWNKTGRDPEVEQLEELLAPLRHEARSAAPLPPPAGRKLRPLHALLALAASVAIAFTIRAWSDASWILMLPPPISLPFSTRSYATARTEPGSLSSLSQSSGCGDVNG